jgi:hypothetical protein
MIAPLEMPPRSAPFPRDGLVDVGVVWPARLERTLGYDGAARYVAWWWEPGGDELAYDDGRTLLVGADWPAWLDLIRDPVWTAALELAAAELGERIELGDSETAARHALLVDTATRVCYVGRLELAAAFVREHAHERRTRAGT